MHKPVRATVGTSLSATPETFGEALARAVRGFRDVFRSRVLTSPPVFPDKYDGSTDRRIDGSTDRRIDGSTDRRIDQPAHGRLGMSAFAWRRRPGCPSFPPESSVAGRLSAPDTPDSSDPASAHRGAAVRAGSAVRRLRPVLAAALLSLPLLAGLATGAEAQTGTVQFSRDTFTIDEGATGGQSWQFQRFPDLLAVTGNSPGGAALTITATDGTAVIGTDYRLVSDDNARSLFLSTQTSLFNRGFYTSANGIDAVDSKRHLYPIPGFGLTAGLFLDPG